MGKPTRKRVGMSDAFSRGFDILRLSLQIHTRALNMLLRLSAVIAILGTLGAVFVFLPLQTIYGGGRWAASWLVVDLLKIDFPGVPVRTQDGVHAFTMAQIFVDPWHRAAWGSLLRTTLISALVAMLSAVPVGLLISAASIWRGREATSDLLARGQRLIDERPMARLVRSRGDASRFRIGRIPLPEKALNRNIVALGAPQTGKSLAIRRWMKEVERRGDIAIVFDKVGDVTAGFYDPERGDVLLNPMDRRSPPWSPWAEMRSVTDAARIANALIPRVEGNNNFFNEGARSLFVALLTRVWRLENRSLLGLLEAALIWDRERKLELLEGTEAAKHFDGDHRSGHDVDATMAVYTQSLRFLPIASGKGEDFSIRDFITGAVTRAEQEPRAALAALDKAFDEEVEALKEARKALSIGDLRRAARGVSRIAKRYPLLPEGLTIPASPEAFRLWRARHGAAIDAHWAEQDERIAEGRTARAREHEAAAERLKRKGSPWLFVATDQRSLQATRPILSLWLDAVADTILSLPENRERRIWIFLDELQALQELPSLQPLMTEGAKYGANVIAGVQNMGQIRAAFGRDRAEVLLSMFQSKLMFRLPEPDTAKWCQNAIGDAIVEHIHESIRYGTSETMDGAQLSTQRVTEPIVMAGDIMRQPDLHCYVSFPGDWPVSRAQLAFDPKTDILPPRAASFEPRPVKDMILNALDAMGFDPIPEGRDGADRGEAARFNVGLYRPDEGSGRERDADRREGTGSTRRDEKAGAAGLKNATPKTGERPDQAELDLAAPPASGSPKPENGAATGAETEKEEADRPEPSRANEVERGPLGTMSRAAMPHGPSRAGDGDASRARRRLSREGSSGARRESA